MKNILKRFSVKQFLSVAIKLIHLPKNLQQKIHRIIDNICLFILILNTRRAKCYKTEMP